MPAPGAASGAAGRTASSRWRRSTWWPAAPPRDLVILDDALAALSELDARKGRVVELRFFGGLSVEDTANVLAVSPQTVMRDWKLAKVWLLREMKRGGGAEGGGARRRGPRAT
jgi:DNA-directed RNA polymerase specialized sigma24 family protein